MEQETIMKFKTTLKGGERVIIHLSCDYMDGLYIQKDANTNVERQQVIDEVIDEIVNFIQGTGEKNYLITYTWIDRDGKTRQSWWLEYIDRDESNNGLTEEKVYNYYQERSVTAGDRADQLAWMFVIMMTGGLISGHAFQTFSVCAALAAIYFSFSIMQAVWQTFTSWLFMRQLRHADTMSDDYPAWVGGGAWLFFWLKMITISAAVIYFVRAIFE